MSVDRHVNPAIPVLRSTPPSEEEIFRGVKKLAALELGMLQMQILWLLNRKSTHGYELMDTLGRIKSTKITQGTLYPALKTLSKSGYIKGKPEGDKIVYEITPSGKKVLDQSCVDFTRTFFGIFQDFVCHKCVGEKE